MPHGFTPKVKSAIRRNTSAYKKWVKPGRNPNDRNKVREVQNSTKKFIRKDKLSYYEKLSYPLTGHKHFWSAFTFKRITSKKKHANTLSLFTIIFMYLNFNKKQIYLTIVATFLIMTASWPESISKPIASISHINITTEQSVYIIKK